jgi:hypothetical protein
VKLWLAGLFLGTTKLKSEMAKATLSLSDTTLHMTVCEREGCEQCNERLSKFECGFEKDRDIAERQAIQKVLV